MADESPEHAKSGEGYKHADVSVNVGRFDFCVLARPSTCVPVLMWRLHAVFNDATLRFKVSAHPANPRF